MSLSSHLSQQVTGQLGWYTLLQFGYVLFGQWRLIQNPLSFLLTGLVKGVLFCVPALSSQYLPDKMQKLSDSLARRVRAFVLQMDGWVSSCLKVRSYEELVAKPILTKDYSNIELIRYCMYAESPSFLLEAAVDQESGRLVRFFGMRTLVWTDFGGWIVGIFLFQKIAKKIRLEG